MIEEKPKTYITETPEGKAGERVEAFSWEEAEFFAYPNIVLGELICEGNIYDSN